MSNRPSTNTLCLFEIIEFKQGFNRLVISLDKIRIKTLHNEMRRRTAVTTSYLSTYFTNYNFRLQIILVRIILKLKFQFYKKNLKKNAYKKISLEESEVNTVQGS